MSVQLDVPAGAGAGTAAVVVDDLHIAVSDGGPEVVHGVSFRIAPGEVLGLVGESGSGKTTVGLAMLGHARRGLTITGGSVRVGEQEVLQLAPAAQRSLRGAVVSYVPQDPASSLNPAVRIGTQLSEVLEHHGTGSAAVRRERVAEMMREVALPDDPAYLRRYPHQLSGGQQQRIGLAMAFACRPRLIVLDEPTTGLDVTTQAHVLSTVRSLAVAHSAAALYVSHDLAVVASLATRVAVMYAGRLVEVGEATTLFERAGHPYTRRLVAAIPHLDGDTGPMPTIPGLPPRLGAIPAGCPFAPRCELHVEQCDEGVPPLAALSPTHGVRCIRADEVTARPASRAGSVLDDEAPSTPDAVLTLQGVSASYSGFRVLHDIDLQLAAGECLALVGESGSGKTTLARTIAGMHRERTGRILLGDVELAPSSRGRDKDSRRRVQYVFQNPYGSLNPRQTIGEIVRQPLQLFGLADKREVDARVGEMLERVSLTAAYARRYPDQLSGGERQRVAIARALVSSPSVLVCDEVTSALDVSVQAAIVDLLGGLQRELGLSMLFVTHNLPLVRSIAQRVAVMSEGRIVEQGDVEAVLAAPSAPYTRGLLANTPSLETVTGGVDLPGQDERVLPGSSV